jgi:teichuronic acid biosynthesis glycosyltransferase TuaC
MNLLVVFKSNIELSEQNFEKNKAFIFDQIEELRKRSISVDVFSFRGRGISSYLQGAFALRNVLRKNNYDLVHAHYGYSGLIAGMVSKVPVVVTYHGTDITEWFSNIISSISIQAADWNIFVSNKLLHQALKKPKNDYSIIPCGVNFDVFIPINKHEALRYLGWRMDVKIILFSSSFSNPIKNVRLARQALSKCGEQQFEFIEIKGKTRQEVAWMLNACDLLLLTSFSEGSPQIVKEAMACNCPIVATDVGDVREVIADTENCYVTGFDPDEIASKISLVLSKGSRSNGEQRIKKMDNRLVVDKIMGVYDHLVTNRKRQ